MHAKIPVTILSSSYMIIKSCYSDATRPVIWMGIKVFSPVTWMVRKLYAWLESGMHMRKSASVLIRRI